MTPTPEQHADHAAAAAEETAEHVLNVAFDHLASRDFQKKQIKIIIQRAIERDRAERDADTKRLDWLDQGPDFRLAECRSWLHEKFKIEPHAGKLRAAIDALSPARAHNEGMQ